MLKEVVTLIINEDECGEVFHFDFPHSLHAKFGIFYALNALDVLLRKDGSGSTDRAQVEATVLFASVGNLLCAVAFGNHNH